MKSFLRDINIKLRILSELPSLSPGEKRDMTGSASGSLGIARVQHVANTTVLGNCFCHCAIKHCGHPSCLHVPSPHAALPVRQMSDSIILSFLSLKVFPPYTTCSLPLQTDLFTREFFLPKMGIPQSAGVYCLQDGGLKRQCYNLI